MRVESLSTHINLLCSRILKMDVVRMHAHAHHWQTFLRCCRQWLYARTYVRIV